jgi:aspartyl-tRNA(Asn)/glutamyl-tRNA(Gln) amidotransferase subunit A
LTHLTRRWPTSVVAEQAVERLRDSFIDYFQRYDAPLCPVTPFPATKHGLADLVIDGQTVSPGKP